MTQKELALKYLEELDIYRPYIKKFNESEIPTFFERCCGYWVDQEERIWNKVKEVQDEYGCLVYALTHEIFEFGSCWSMLCVPKSFEEEDECIIRSDMKDNIFYAFAYVYNEDAPFLSEFGDVVVQSAIGGIRRIG